MFTVLKVYIFWAHIYFEPSTGGHGIYTVGVGENKDLNVTTISVWVAQAKCIDVANSSIHYKNVRFIALCSTQICA